MGCRVRFDTLLPSRRDRRMSVGGKRDGGASKRELRKYPAGMVERHVKTEKGVPDHRTMHALVHVTRKKKIPPQANTSHVFIVNDSFFCLRGK